jgi:hypothetical protein
MPTYKAPVDDALFLLNDVFHIERYGNIPSFAEATPDTVAAVLSEGGKFVEQVLQPLNRVGDLEGCTRHADGSVTTPKGFKDAYRQLAEGGWIGLAMEPEFGGQGLPHTIAIIMNEFMTSANMAFTMYSGLTQGAYLAIRMHGNERLHKTYLPRIANGEWAATMNLTEPHCGTDLGHVAHQGGAAARRQLQDQRHQDFHLRRRTRSRAEHHPSCACAHRRRARRHEGHFAVRRPENSREGRRLARREEWRLLRLHRREDGHSRQFDLRDELRQCDRLARRRGKSRTAGHVHDDERSAPRRRRAGPRALRGRLSERGCLRERAPAGPLAHRPEVSRQARRSDHCPSGHSPRPDDHARLQRSRARFRDLDRAAGRSCDEGRGRESRARPPTTIWA